MALLCPYSITWIHSVLLNAILCHIEANGNGKQDRGSWWMIITTAESVRLRKNDNENNGMEVRGYTRFGRSLEGGTMTSGY